MSKRPLEVGNVPESLKALVRLVIREESINQWLSNPKSMRATESPLMMLGEENPRLLRSNVRKIVDAFYAILGTINTAKMPRISQMTQNIVREISQKKNLIASVEMSSGSRKTANARVFLKPGTGKHKVNGIPMEEYFKSPIDRKIIYKPLVLAGLQDEYDLIANVKGGGTSGQSGAILHGLSRALVKTDNTGRIRAMFKKEGYLTRDSRQKERKKYGRKGARRGFQFSKR